MRLTGYLLSSSEQCISSFIYFLSLFFIQLSFIPTFLLFSPSFRCLVIDTPTSTPSTNMLPINSWTQSTERTWSAQTMSLEARGEKLAPFLPHGRTTNWWQTLDSDSWFLISSHYVYSSQVKSIKVMSGQVISCQVKSRDIKPRHSRSSKFISYNASSLSHLKHTISHGRET